MHESGAESAPKSPEILLMEEVLSSPDLRHEAKGHRTREVIRFLFDLYKNDPLVAATEEQIALAVYDGPDEPGESLVRRAISRARDHLESYCEKLDTTRYLRVRIPQRQYRLEFYKKYLRFGIEPLVWFWGAYLENPKPIALGFAIPDAEPSLLSPDQAADLYRHCAALVAGGPGGLPEILQAGWNTTGSYGDGLDLEFPAQTIAIGLPPYEDYLFADIWKVLPAASAMKPFRDPLGKVAVSDPMSESEPGMYVTTRHKAYVLLTRHNSSPDSQCQLTILAGPDADSIQKIMALITTKERLFNVVTSGELGDSELPKERAPDQFQVLFEVTRFPKDSLRIVNSRVLKEPPPPDDWGPG